jgi:TPR repeat protein
MFKISLLLCAVVATVSLYANALDQGRTAYKQGELTHAFASMSNACAQANSEACFIKATLYRYGQGVEQNYHKAQEFYTKACESGSAQACYELGRLYDYGLGTEQNSKKADDLYTLACYNGNDQGCARCSSIDKL